MSLTSKLIVASLIAHVSAIELKQLEVPHIQQQNPKELHHQKNQKDLAKHIDEKSDADSIGNAYMPEKGADAKAVNADADKADFADKFSNYLSKDPKKLSK